MLQERLRKKVSFGQVYLYKSVNLSLYVYTHKHILYIYNIYIQMKKNKD